MYIYGAIPCGLKARTMIRASDDRRGIFRMWWCLLVGGIGLVWMTAITTIIIFKII